MWSELRAIPSTFCDGQNWTLVFLFLFMYLYPYSEPFLLLRKTVCGELQAQDRSLIRLQNAEEHQYAGISVIVTIISKQNTGSYLQEFSIIQSESPDSLSKRSLKAGCSDDTSKSLHNHALGFCMSNIFNFLLYIPKNTLV